MTLQITYYYLPNIVMTEFPWKYTAIRGARVDIGRLARHIVT